MKAAFSIATWQMIKGVQKGGVATSLERLGGEGGVLIPSEANPLPLLFFPCALNVVRGGRVKKKQGALTAKIFCKPL